MTERYGEPTRYLTFKPDKYAGYLSAPYRNVFIEILQSGPEGITFEELLMRASYKEGFIGPRLLRASLKQLFDRDYIITNRQMAALKEKHGIDAQRLRRHEP